jgi:hypothetical protein
MHAMDGVAADGGRGTRCPIVVFKRCPTAAHLVGDIVGGGAGAGAGAVGGVAGLRVHLLPVVAAEQRMRDAAEEAALLL